LAANPVNNERDSLQLSVSARVQVWIVALMLAILGSWGLIEAWLEQTWPPSIVSAAMVVTAFGALTRRWWARYFIFALSALNAGTWVWFVGRSLMRGYFSNKGATYLFISLLPLNAFLAMACYWAYVAAVHLKNRTGG
jgi:hypothetical protein